MQWMFQHQLFRVAVSQTESKSLADSFALFMALLCFWVTSNDCDSNGAKLFSQGNRALGHNRTIIQDTTEALQKKLKELE